jgi:hypothetical protein
VQLARRKSGGALRRRRADSATPTSVIAGRSALSWPLGDAPPKSDRTAATSTATAGSSRSLDITCRACFMDIRRAVMTSSATSEQTFSSPGAVRRRHRGPQGARSAADTRSMHFSKAPRLAVSGLLTAALVWALLPSALQARPPGRSCHRYWSAGDRAARNMARNAETFVVTLATEHQGSYTKVSPRTIHALERGIPITPRQARRKQERAYLLSASGTASSYVLTTRSRNGDTYSIRYRSGQTKHYARVCGEAQDW